MASCDCVVSCGSWSEERRTTKYTKDTKQKDRCGSPTVREGDIRRVTAVTFALAHARVFCNRRRARNTGFLLIGEKKKGAGTNCRRHRTCSTEFHLLWEHKRQPSLCPKKGKRLTEDHLSDKDANFPRKRVFRELRPNVSWPLQACRKADPLRCRSARSILKL